MSDEVLDLEDDENESSKQKGEEKKKEIVYKDIIWKQNFNDANTGKTLFSYETINPLLSVGQEGVTQILVENIIIDGKGKEVNQSKYFAIIANEINFTTKVINTAVRISGKQVKS